MDAKCQKDVEEYNRKCLQIVQKYLEIFDPNDADSIRDFLEDCHFMTRAYFEDIIEERACADLCGYVLCKNLLTNTSKKQFRNGQKYHIQRNVVYDITRRKNFCSNHCFHCAEYLRTQINTEPVFLRKSHDNQTPNSLKLFQDKTNGQFGDVIPLQDPLDNVPKSKSNEQRTKPTTAQQSIRNQILKNEKSVENKLSAPYLKVEEFHQLKQKFQEFTIRENQMIIGDSHHENSIKFDSVVNTNENHESPDSTGVEISDETDKSSVTTSGSTKARKSKKQRKHFASELLRQMSEWVTMDSRNFLGIKQIEEDLQSNPVHELSVEDEQKKLERYRWEYIRLCAKLNQEELEDEEYDRMVLNEQKKSAGKNPRTKNKTISVLKESKSSTPIAQQNAGKILDNQQELSSLLMSENNHGKVVESSDSKRVRFNEVVEENRSGQIAHDRIQDTEDPGSEEPSEELITPLNDNQHCDIKRRKSFLGILQKNLDEIFEDQFNVHEIGDVLDQIKSLVNTFDLNAQNTDLCWRNHHLVTIVLLRTLLIFDKIDRCKYTNIFEESNPMIKTIMDLFDMTMESMDELIRKIYRN